MSFDGGSIFNITPDSPTKLSSSIQLPSTYSPPYRTQRLGSIQSPPPPVPSKSPIELQEPFNPIASTSNLHHPISRRTTITTTTTISKTTNNNNHQKLSLSSSSLSIRPDINDLPLSPLPHHLEPFLSKLSPLTSLEKQELFTKIYLNSASSGNADTLEWLLSIPIVAGGGSGGGVINKRSSIMSILSNNVEIDQTKLSSTIPRKWINLEKQDEEGNTALTLSVALGHSDCVRILIEGGINISGRDKLGWTGLHWAVQNNDIPITSYLLNHNASSSILSEKGLRARDLVKRGKEGDEMRNYLKSAEEATAERDLYLAAVEEAQRINLGGGGGGKGKEREEDRPGSRASMISINSVSSHTTGEGGISKEDKIEEVRKEREMMKRMEMAMESAQLLEVDLHILGLGGTTTTATRGSTTMTTTTTNIHSPQDDEEDGIQNPFIWERCLPDQMIVFSMDDLSIIFDVVITNMKPVRARLYRVIPANVVFLCARFAHYFGSRELLDELFLGAIERIEAAVHHRPDDMANCAFWLSNTLLLLYFLRKEPNLFDSTADFQIHLSDLVNEIFVFVIRDAERRIDRVLETAMLEFEGVPGFEDVEFEGDWSGSRFVKKLTGRGKKTLRHSTSTLSIFASSTTAATTTTENLPGSAPNSPSSRPAFLHGGGNNSNNTSNSNIPSNIVITSPRTITALLSSTLFILQIYEIPPSIVVQAFSQLFYWISCEVFNRLISQKKYLCRSKAIQIRLNVSNLEDWARINRLPTRMVSVHFAPLNQLLQWLQCLSSESSIDGLIGTIQSLRSLNPLQLRKAVREYKFEVDETRMSEECSQYLIQIQKQWERVNLQKSLEEIQSSSKNGNLVGGTGGGDIDSVRSNSPTGSMMSAQSDVSKMIDEVFSDPEGFGHYSPPGGVEALGELLNSRYMLPFAVPSSAEMLVNFKNKDAFGPFAPPPSLLSHRPSTSTLLFESFDTTPIPSPTNLSTNLPPPSFPEGGGGGETLEIDNRFVPVLPDDFFSVLDQAKAHYYGISATLLKEREQGLIVGMGMGDISGTNTNSSMGSEWFDWRENSGEFSNSKDGNLVIDTEDEDEDEDEDEEGNSYGVEETPRQRNDGFESNPAGHY